MENVQATTVTTTNVETALVSPTNSNPTAVSVDNNQIANAAYTWSQMDTTWDDLNATWDDIELQTPPPEILVGNTTAGSVNITNV